MLINAGFAGDAWSGGEVWNSAELVAEITRFVCEGGALIGVAEPSACPGGDSFLRLAHVLGVDIDHGEYACHAPWSFEVQPAPFAVCDDALAAMPGARLTDPDTKVLVAEGGAPRMTLHAFGKGCAAWLSGFEYSPAAARMLLELLLHMTGRTGKDAGISDDPMVETAWFPASKTLVVMNDANAPVEANIEWPGGTTRVALGPEELKFVQV